MKKKLKMLSLFIALIISFIIIPNDIFALSTEYKDINESIEVNNGNLQFSNISFKKFDGFFGLGGIVYNSSENNLTFDATVRYYNADYQLVFESEVQQIVPKKQHNSYSQLSNSYEIGMGYTVDDIAYYKLEIEENNESQFLYYDYYINNYDITIVVNEDNTLEITEKIGSYFNIYKHGIFRKIPLKNKITRLDGTTSANRAFISNISVNEQYTTSTENGYKVIKIGDPDRTIKGQKNYVINYLYNLGKDTGKDYDELYFNLIGDEWDTVISNVTFTIIMPKEFDASKLGFSSGVRGSTDSSFIEYNVNGNVITGKLNKTLFPNNALTVRLELPEGYFVNAGAKMTASSYLMFLIPAIALIISYAIWKKYGKDEPVVETVEFYPPEGFNSLEVAYLHKGSADRKDITSLLIYLANKGYIKIEETKESGLFGSSESFKIIKLKEYDGNNENEKIFLKGLFKNSSTVDYNKAKEIRNEAKANGEKISYLKSLELATNTDEKQSVTNSDLYDKFYTTMNAIMSNINSKKMKNMIFETNTTKKSITVMLLLIASLITIIAIPTLDYATLGDLAITLFICLFYVPFYAVGIFAKGPIGFKIFWLGFTIFHSFFFFSTMPIATAIVYNPYYLIGLIFGLICVIGMCMLFKLMPKRNEYGIQILGKINGFKTFLETVEKEKLEAMVLENPTYFYDILPFTYVLGVSDKWIKKFESISLQAPDWYTGSTNFNVKSFGSFMNNTMTSAQRSMSSSPSSSSGGSSGGGSSGGGSGGGGGGSW